MWMEGVGGEEVEFGKVVVSYGLGHCLIRLMSAPSLLIRLHPPMSVLWFVVMTYHFGEVLLVA